MSSRPLVESIRVPNGQILRAAIAMVNQAFRDLSGAEGLLQSVES